MMKVFLPILFALLFCSMHAQSPLQLERAEPRQPYTHLNFKNDPEHFQFAIVTDRTGGHRPGVFETAVQKLNLLQPEFVMSVGDLIEGYTEDMDVLLQEWKEFDGFVDQLLMPFFYVPGNHDITNQVMEDLWKKRFGHTYYHFVYKNVLFLCLNSEDQRRGSSRGTISDEQYEYIQQTLAANTEVRWTLVFMHQPLWVQEAETLRWKDVEALLAGRPHTVFAGHQHHYVKYERNEAHYFMLATTGGGSSLRGPRMGEFDHVVWVTMTEAGPLIANLQLEGIWDENVMTEETRTLIDAMVAKQAFQVEPLYLEGSEFEKGTMHLRIRNDENVPMQVRFRQGFSWDLVSGVEPREAIIAPNSQQRFQVDMQSRNTKPLAEKEALLLKVDVTYEIGVEQAITIPFQFRLKPFEKLNISKAAGPIVIDGQFQDWGKAPLLYYKQTDDPDDLSIRYGLQYDKDYLYVAAQVRDSDLNLDTALVNHRQDGIGLILNGALLRESVQAKGEGWYEEEAMLRISPATATLPSVQYLSEGWPEGAHYSCQEVEGGYHLEVAVPIRFLNAQQAGNWKTARINLVLQDYDLNFTDGQRHFIFPDWRFGDNVPGSGMFFREE